MTFDRWMFIGHTVWVPFPHEFRVNPQKARKTTEWSNHPLPKCTLTSGPSIRWKLSRDQNRSDSCHKDRWKSDGGGRGRYTFMAVRAEAVAIRELILNKSIQDWLTTDRLCSTTNNKRVDCRLFRRKLEFAEGRFNRHHDFSDNYRLQKRKKRTKVRL